MHNLLPSEKKFGFDYEYTNMAKVSSFSNRFPSQENERKITSNRPDMSLPDNAIHTCKYNLLTFFPKNLFLQYTNVANIYFLALGVLQLFPMISNSEGQPTIWAPLFIINLATAGKDLYEDLKRRKADTEENKTQSTKIESMGDSRIPWMDIRVGQIIRIAKNEFFPCDILILDTSEPKGICYIETKNLDGETNLKQKFAQSDIYHFEQNKQYLENYFTLEYEKPNAYLYKFNGRAVLPDAKQVSIDANNFVLRGCSLRNTKWVIGLVTYTGHDTKLLMNSFKMRAKKSRLEHQMQSQIILIFCLMLLMSCFGALFNVLATTQNTQELYYLELEDQHQFYVFIIQFFSWILNISNLVPISLLVTLEIVKMTQGIFISLDEGMRHQATQIPTQVQSSNLNEELGQVQYVFSDKTGTLTCNIMEYKKVSINGKSYGECKKGQPSYLDDISSYPKVTNVDFRDRTFFTAFEKPSSPEFEPIRKTLFLLALCHTIIIERTDGQITYNASSPDELALINFAKFCGVQFMGNNEENIMEVKFREQMYRYQLLHVLEFNSTRKRMSVILKDLSRNDGLTLLLTKGADTIILERLSKTKQHSSTQGVLESTVQNLANYGNIGLRTLLLAEREIPNDVFTAWNSRYLEASASLDNRDERMSALQDEIETEMMMVGATAIEDKLQDEVGETIDALLKAGIRVWVLTGDKIETAINIALSCRLLNSDMEKLIVDEKEESALVTALEDCMKQLKFIDGKRDVAFIISGDALLHGLKSTVSRKIMEIGSQCRAVVCCRVSPKQKQEVVSLVRKERPNVTTLAIGDGANDVNMITAAHVGVGIKGLEGAQAARASDYAIGEFKIIRRLLFYHGRECYRRNTQLILYNFYKNVLIAMPQFWFGSRCYFSGPNIYDNYTYQFFNVFFAALPIMVFAVFDSEFAPLDLEHNYKNYYEDGMKSKLFNGTIFWATVLNASVQSLIIIYASYYSIEVAFPNPDGVALSVWAMGAMVIGMVVVVANIKILIMSNDHSIVSATVVIGSMIAYLISFAIVSNVLYTGGQLYAEFVPIFSTPMLHIGNILIIAATTTFDLAAEWHSRWRANMLRRFDYIKRLETELQKEEDSIIFVQQQVSVSHTPQPTRFHMRQMFGVSNKNHSSNINGSNPNQSVHSVHNHSAHDIQNHSNHHHNQSPMNRSAHDQQHHSMMQASINHSGYHHSNHPSYHPKNTYFTPTPFQGGYEYASPQHMAMYENRSTYERPHYDEDRMRPEFSDTVRQIRETELVHHPAYRNEMGYYQ